MTNEVSPSDSGRVEVPPGRHAAMRFILLTVVIDMISIGLIIPVLPHLIGTFTHSQADQAFWFGAVSFSFGIANFFFSPILGALSDRFGRRPVLLIGFCGLALSFFGTALASALWMLIAIRLVSGAMQSNIAVANAYVADITEPQDRARRFGQLGAMFGIGFILGPVLGGILGSINVRLPFFLAGSLALLNLAYGFFVLPESLPIERRRPLSWRSANPVSSLKALGNLRGVGRLVLVISLTSMCDRLLQTCWVLYTTFKFGWGPRENGWSLFAVGLMSAIGQGVLLGRLLKHFGAQRLAVYGLASSTACYLLWGLATQGWMIFAVIGCNVLGFTAAASIQSIISNAADPKTQGQTMGALSSLNSLMAVFAPVIGAPLLVAVSHLPAGDPRIGMPYYFCSLLTFIAMLVAIHTFSAARKLEARDAV